MSRAFNRILIVAGFAAALTGGALPRAARAEQIVSADTLVSLAEACVRGRAGVLPAGATLALDTIVHPSAVTVPDGLLRIDVAAADTRIASLMTPVARISVNGRVVRSVPVPLRLRLIGPRLRTTRTLSEGDSVTADAMQAVVEEIPVPWDAWVANARELEGLVPARVIAAGEIVRAELFETAALVRRGDTVMLELESPSVRILARGTAREDGRAGQKIRVARDGERRVLHAVVVSRDRVRVAANQRYY
ncbi:MAG: flagellar basal body P-ring formation chaperone FlgA [bacterium]